MEGKLVIITVQLRIRVYMFRQYCCLRIFINTIHSFHSTGRRRRSHKSRAFTQKCTKTDVLIPFFLLVSVFKLLLFIPHVCVYLQIPIQRLINSVKSYYHNIILKKKMDRDLPDLVEQIPNTGGYESDDERDGALTVCQYIDPFKIKFQCKQY